MICLGLVLISNPRPNTKSNIRIGRELCKRLVVCGAKVVAVSKSKEPLDSLVEECPSIEAVLLDIGADWHKTAEVIEKLGTFDCLVNNAAVAICSPFLEVKPEEIDEMFKVNVKAVINVTQAVTKGMVKAGKAGSIVNVSSQASKAALKNHTVYCGTKGALDAISGVMALELGTYGIRVNCVNPTVVLTDMGREHWTDKKAEEMLDKIPLHRFAEVSEVVNTIIFLLSDVAPMVNAVTLPVDGGFLAC
ncbi:L-xylulose reductase-like isoform X1 [Macrosteles quadrilineatus]|uniref:L-xylulose reductase-like isoform X1 n=1 Tax=Macrosteles quadrilineatus TaxID=74068 RepID=UPI0023E0B1F8|nr:L-xylulose reductase-like isoform X1 [Macrosteles quadrilineatus]